jgi:peptide/nickel transport system substrate-binding protein
MIQPATRRRFLYLLSLASTGGLLAACSQAAPPAAPTAAPQAANSPAASAASPAAASPVASPAVAAPVSPSAAPSVAPAVVASAAPASSSAPAAAGQPGGTLRTTLGAEPGTLDPARSNTLFDADVHDSLYEGLFSNRVYDPITGALADSWNTPDGKTWTIKLKQGVQFHDGTEVTSDAVKFSIDRIKDPATTAGAQVLGRVTQIDSMTLPDKYTVVFQLKNPSATFPLDMSDVMIVPSTFNADKPVGTGPFMFVEWVRNQHVQVKKFPNYHETGLPYLDGVLFLPTPDENQKVNLLQTGQVDVTDTIPLPRYDELNTPDSKVVVISIPTGVSPSSYFMLARTDQKPLDDPKVRQAINWATDRQAMLDINFGVGTIKSNAIPPKSWAFDSSVPSYNSRDVARAKQLLSDAGYANGFSVQLKHITSRAEYIPMGQLFQSNLADVGIKVELIPQDINTWIDDAQNHYNFQLALTGVIPGPEPDTILTQLYDPNQANGKMTFYSNDMLNSLIAQGRATVNQDDRKKIYSQAQQIIMTDLPAWAINERPILFGATPAVQGFAPDTRQHLHFHSVWLKQG